MSHTLALVLTILGIAFLVFVGVVIVGFVVTLFMWRNTDKH